VLAWMTMHSVDRSGGGLDAYALTSAGGRARRTYGLVAYYRPAWIHGRWVDGGGSRRRKASHNGSLGPGRRAKRELATSRHCADCGQENWAKCTPP